MKDKKISDILANLLVLLGEVSDAELPKLLDAVNESGIPLGRLLVMCRRLNEDELQSALVAAKLVQRGALNANRAAIILAYCFFWHLSFESVWQRADFNKSNTVTMLLMAAGLLHKTHVVELAEKTISGSYVGGAELYQEGLITIEQWRETLTQAILLSRLEINLRQVLFEPEDGPTTAELPIITSHEDSLERLGNLLLQSGLVVETELLCALERGLECGERLGEILLRWRIITTPELTAALRLQSLVSNKSLTKAQAVTWLQQVPQSPGLQIVFGNAA